MHSSTDVNTPFHIDFEWWESSGRNFNRFLAEILESDDGAISDHQETLDYIDPATAEVHQLSALWTQVLTERASKPDYITSSTPMTNALLRALIENRNKPMTAAEMQRRISRGNPKALLRVLRTARLQYGIVPVKKR
jgi:hypothetical protein